MKISSPPNSQNSSIYQTKVIKKQGREPKNQPVCKPKKEGFKDMLASSYLIYRLRNIGKCPYTFNYDLLEQSGIPNLHPLNDNGVRGGTLSGRKGRKFIPILKKAGIKNVIDLRGGDASSSYEELCKKNGLNYYNIPLNPQELDSAQLTENLQKLFQVINKGKFYIGCAQGLHRTDIAVAINYMFNPKASTIPPKMYGHVFSSGFQPQEIFAKTNSVFKTLTDEDKAKLGLNQFSKEEYARKKALLTKYNDLYAKQATETELVPM